MASQRFSYSQTTRRYRDEEKGRTLTEREVMSLREEFLDAAKGATVDLAEQLAESKITTATWEREMRVIVREAHVAAAALGGGGRSVMTAGDWLAVGRQLKGQYGYLGRFADEAQEMTAAGIANRAGMYVDAAVQGFERARAARHGIEGLPGYPGDGETPCLSRCRCSWVFEEADSQVSATWTLSGDDSCTGCEERAAQWAPFVIERSRQRAVAVNGNGKHE